MNIQKLFHPLHSLIDLIYPELCPCCQHRRPMNNHIICLPCMADLPFTGHEKYPQDNETAMTFWGRVPLKAACSIFYFNPKGKIRNVLHRIKYEGRSDIAVEMGKLMGHYLNKAIEIKSADIIIPIPLHPKRKTLRGFNQSDYLAKGLSEKLDVPWSSQTVIRTQNNPSQTKLSRENRFDNTNQIFEVIASEMIKGRKVLLIDDVVTTGATLENCAEVLLKNGAESVVVATLACGEFL